MKAKRQQAIDLVKSWSQERLSEIIVRSHFSICHEFIEVYPNGDVYDTEEPDNNTRHYVSYPSKPVEVIYNVHDESYGACNCDVCEWHRAYVDLDEDTFLRLYGSEALSCCKSMTHEEAILAAAYNNGISEEDIREEIISNIENIQYGYFDDED